VESGKVEYVQLPVQLKRTTNDEQDELLWDSSQMPQELVAKLKSQARKSPKSLPIEQWCFTPNEVKNSRGYIVMGDARSRGTGWGHHATAIPTAIGNQLYVPAMNGTVYVLDTGAETFDEQAILAINDLGPVGQSFNRASLSFAGGRLYAHTIGEVVCIQNTQPLKEEKK